MAGDFRRLAELGMVPLLAKEVAACINAGTVTATNLRRLTELSMIPREIRELRNQLATPAMRLSKRWTEIGVSPRLARELVTQIGGGVVAPLSITGTPAAATVGSGDTFAPTISGGTAPYTLSLASGTLPPGRSIAGNTVIGTYTTAGTYSYTLRATDAAAATANLPLTVTVAAAGAAVAQPSGFTFAGPTTPTISRSGTGTASTFTTDYSESARKAAITPAATFYVRNAGNNANDGLTPATAFKSLRKAVDAGNKTLAAYKINYEAALPGATPILYLDTDSQTDGTTVWGAAWRATDVLYDAIFEPSVAGGVAYSVPNRTLGTFTATSDPNIYQSTNVAIRLYDFANMDRMACPRMLTPLLVTPADTANPFPEINAQYALFANATDGGASAAYSQGVSYRNPAGTLFVRLFNNRAPDASLYAQNTTAANAPGVLATMTRNVRAYVEGLRFTAVQGGPAFQLRGSAGFRPVFDFVRCGFIGGSGAGSLTVEGVTTSDGVDTICVSTMASYSTFDGFNYHQRCRFVEINCGGDWNGYEGGLANNGSTAHEDTQGIRVSGSYRQNQDRPINDVINSLTWNLGISASTRRGQDGQDQSAVYVSGISGQASSLVPQMWLDACVIQNGVGGQPQYNTAVYGTASFIRYANLAFTPTAGPGNGNVAVYTP